MILDCSKVLYSDLLEINFEILAPMVAVSFFILLREKRYSEQREIASKKKKLGTCLRLGNEHKI